MYFLNAITGKSGWVSAALVFSLCQVSVALAEEGPGYDIEFSRPAEAKNQIHPGDQINVVVQGEKELSGIYKVDSSGNISFPLVGLVKVEGSTVEQVRDDLQAALGKDFLMNPQVEVSYEKSVINSVNVLGQVNNPGNYILTPGMTALRIISQAGGFTQGAAYSTVKIVRPVSAKKNESIVVDVERILNGQTLDPKLLPGDMVFIPRIVYVSEEKDDYLNSIPVIGGVKTPGNYKLAAGMTLIRILSQAGGFIEGANPGMVSITRMEKDGKATVLSIDTKAIIEGKAPDIALQVGDTVYVPGFSDRGDRGIDFNHVVSVLGQVKSPNNFDLAKGLTLLKVITQAGGFSPTADPGKVKITRKTPQGQRVLVVNAAKIINGQSEDVPLETGDIIYVPESIF